MCQHYKHSHNFFLRGTSGLSWHWRLLRAAGCVDDCSLVWELRLWPGFVSLCYFTLPVVPSCQIACSITVHVPGEPLCSSSSLPDTFFKAPVGAQAPDTHHHVHIACSASRIARLVSSEVWPLQDLRWASWSLLGLRTSQRLYHRQTWGVSFINSQRLSIHCLSLEASTTTCQKPLPDKHSQGYML